MKDYRPLLFEDVDLSIAGLRVTCLRLNRHTPEATPQPHRHEGHGQLLVYLNGAGWQEVDGERTAARPGTVIYVAPGREHAFERRRARRPLCLVLDVSLADESRIRQPVAQLNATGLTRIRSQLSGLFGFRRTDSESMVLHLGTVILGVLDPVMAALGWLGEKRTPARRMMITRKVERALVAAMGEGDGGTLRDLAERLGYQQDHLNRLLKAECGLTLGQLQAKGRLEQAQRLLRNQGLPVGEIAEQIGMLDNNYFARWFKQQTGVTPSAWRRG